MARLRYILPIVALLVLAGWLYSDDIPRPDLNAALQGLQKTLSQLQTDIKDLQSSVKELAHDAKTKPRANAQPAVQTAVQQDSSNWERAQEAYERGRHAEDSSAYGPAIEAFTEAIDLDPKNDSAFLHRGYSHFYLGDYAMAVSDIGHSLTLQPNNSRAYAMRASALAASGRTNDAIADATQAIQRDPNNAENYLLRAGFQQQTGQVQEALSDYGQAIQLAPELAKAYLGRASILRAHGQLPESLSDCSNAIQLNPSDSAAYVCRAQFYLATGAAQPALEDINRAMLIGQNPAEAAALLSQAQKMIDVKVPEAVKVLETKVVAQVHPEPAPATAPDPAPTAPPVVAPPQLAPTISQVKPPQVLSSGPVGHDANKFYRMGRDLSEQENFDGALQAFGQAIQLDPTHAMALNGRGYAHLRLHQYPDAISDCSLAIRLNPSYANAYVNRAVAKKAMGDIAGSREDLHRATELENVAQATLAKPLARQ